MKITWNSNFSVHKWGLYIPTATYSFTYCFCLSYQFEQLQQTSHGSKAKTIYYLTSYRKGLPCFYYRACPFSFLLNYLFLIRKQENAHIWNILHALLIVFLSLERQTKVKRPFPGIWLSYYKAEEILHDTGIVHSAVWMVSEPNQPHYLERTTGWKNLNSLYLGTPTQLFRVVALKYPPKAKQRSSPNSRFRTENVFWDRHSHFSFPKRIKTT